jgi:plastocyanin
MKRTFLFGLLVLMMLVSLTGFTPLPAAALANTSTARTYTVLVGSESVRQAVSIMSFFPGEVTVHVGDAVTWKANSHEIHTVTFLAGTDMPEFLIGAPAGSVSPLQFNPLGAFPVPPSITTYDGKSYVNSGIMSTDPGQVKTFSLTFTRAGVFPYVCIVHGMMMSGTVRVVRASTPVPSPYQSWLKGQAQIRRAWAKVPAVLADARSTLVPPVKNPDGTTTHTVMVGYSSGVIDVMRFFPSRVYAKPGDTIVWKLNAANVAPHTVTFLNGHEDPELVLPVTPPVPPLLLLNPEVLFPSPNSLPVPQALNQTDFFNSGLLNPGTPQTSFAYTVGNFSGVLDYFCALHDTSGMLGKVIVMAGD